MIFSGFSKQARVWLVAYLCLLIIYSIFSFSLTAPNLILINTSWFESFQFWMWQTFFNNRVLLAQTYTVLITLILICYALIITSLKKEKAAISFKQQVILILFLSAPLLISNNALSFDVFNYIFNSRMVWLYQANPHIRTAIEFPHDTWIRFMHNVHTPAPYGYGWTGLSLLPYIMGFRKFIITWLNFRLLSLISLILTSITVSKTYQLLFKSNITLFHWSLVFINPLILIEIISNSHNDLWMIFPAVAGMALLLWAKKFNNKKKFLYSCAGILAFIFSISIKFATLALLPIYFLLMLDLMQLFKKSILSQFIEKLLAHLPLLASLLMFLPLFTARSQQFHPWYLTWSLIWLPLIKNKYWRQALIAFSLTSLLRYVPWLITNEYSSQVLTQQKIITWSAPFLAGIYTLMTFAKDKFKIKA
jgi:hypothetical protein